MNPLMYGLILSLCASGCVGNFYEQHVKIGELFPHFKLEAALSGKVTSFASEDLTSKYVMLFFYPKDFTFVCPTELWALQERLKDFQAKQTQVLAVSTDTVQTHEQWLNTPKNDGGVLGITYPLLADPSRSLTKRLGILQTAKSVAFRATYLLKREGDGYILKHITINDLPYGRNIDEFLRLIDSFEHHEKHGEVCPANWRYGKPAIEMTKESVSDYLKHQ